MKLIVGLGNPGKEYENTRHNVGFMVLDYFPGNKNWREKFQGMYCELTINNEKVLFLKPMTYMNNSGYSVIKYMDYFDIAIDDVLVIHDDMDLDVGKYKLKKNSSSGGHNGIKSIISSLHSENFARLKIGIAHDRALDTRDYVLGKMRGEQLELMKKNFDLYVSIIEMFVKDGLDRAMNVYNTK